MAITSDSPFTTRLAVLRRRWSTLDVIIMVGLLTDRAAMADAAATVIANAVDLPEHPSVTRVPASSLAPDSDLGDRLVTQEVSELSPIEIETALDAAVLVARRLLADGSIRSAALHLRGDTRVVGPEKLSTLVRPQNSGLGWSSASALH
jgi:hypothetical protein